MSLNRLSYEDQLQSAAAFIREGDDFLVVSHLNPDGDAVSSTLAVGWMLHQLNKRFVMINEGPVPGKFNYLWGSGEIVDFSASPAGIAYHHVISVDCADYSRIGEVRQLFAEDSPSLLNIDHHPTNDFFGTRQLIKTDAAATVEILYDLANTLDIRWAEELGNCVYTGLLTDTGGFRYSNTTPKVMHIASEMLKFGVNGNSLADLLLEKLTMAHVRLLQKALAGLTFSDGDRIAWVSVSNEDIREAGASNEDLEGLVNYPRNIEGVEVGILFKQTEAGQFKASLRSAGHVNVAEVAQRFGGGGHVRAAGCTLTGSLEEAVQNLVTEVRMALI